MVKMFESETCHHIETPFPKEGSVATHKVHGKCKVWRVDKEDLSVTISPLNDPYNFIEAVVYDLVY